MLEDTMSTDELAWEAPCVIHNGQTSSVTLCWIDGEAVAVKAYNKAKLAPRHYLNLRREVCVLTHLRELGTPGVVQLMHADETPDAVLLFFRAARGGDMYRSIRTGAWDEARLCQRVVAPLLQVLVELHALGYVHRDIKPENIFFGEDGALQLGDFGLTIDQRHERPISRVGTLDYMAPEVLAQPSAQEAAQLPHGWLASYDEKVDTWGVGVLVMEALTGRPPFAHANPAVAALKARFQAPPPPPPGASAACADFVRAALSQDARRRPGAAQLLAHPWVALHTGPRARAASPVHGSSGLGCSGGGPRLVWCSAPAFPLAACDASWPGPAASHAAAADASNASSGAPGAASRSDSTSDSLANGSVGSFPLHGSRSYQSRGNSSSMCSSAAAPCHAAPCHTAACHAPRCAAAAAPEPRAPACDAPLFAGAAWRAPSASAFAAQAAAAASPPAPCMRPPSMGVGLASPGGPSGAAPAPPRRRAPRRCSTAALLSPPRCPPPCGPPARAPPGAPRASGGAPGPASAFAAAAAATPGRLPRPRATEVPCARRLALQRSTPAPLKDAAWLLQPAAPGSGVSVSEAPPASAPGSPRAAPQAPPPLGPAAAHGAHGAHGAAAQRFMQAWAAAARRVRPPRPPHDAAPRAGGAPRDAGGAREARGRAALCVEVPRSQGASPSPFCDLDTVSELAAAGEPADAFAVLDRTCSAVAGPACVVSARACGSDGGASGGSGDSSDSGSCRGGRATPAVACGQGGRAKAPPASPAAMLHTWMQAVLKRRPGAPAPSLAFA